MNLMKYDLHAPRNQAEFGANIDAMFSGEPFWSIAPEVAGEIPIAKSEELLQRYADQEFGAEKVELGLRAMILDQLGTAMGTVVPEAGAPYRFTSGRFNERPFTPNLHIDGSRLKERRATSRVAVAGYPIGTLAVEGPVQLQLTGFYTDLPRNVQELILQIQEKRAKFEVLEGQEPTPIGAGKIAVFSECTIHKSPPHTGEPRWWARQFLLPTQLSA